MKDYTEQINTLRDTATYYRERPGIVPSALIEEFESAANSIEELAKIAEKLREAGAAMHTWIFLNSFDEQEAYDEIGLTPEQNALFGYGGQFIIQSKDVHNCYNCAHGDDGESEFGENIIGHCWLHNGEADFEQPDKLVGCAEWKEREAKTNDAV